MIERLGVPEIDTNRSMSLSKTSPDWAHVFPQLQSAYILTFDNDWDVYNAIFRVSELSLRLRMLG
jgi:hypothetical protein